MYNQNQFIIKNKKDKNKIYVKMKERYKNQALSRMKL